ncbi:MAG: Mpo1-like protein [Patescibacteria group bacterium]
MFAEIVERALQKYIQYHQHPTNEKVHLVGIPLIIIGIAILLTNLLAFWVFFLIIAIYCLLSWREGLVLACWFWLFAFLGMICPWYVGLILIGVSFGVQTITHKIYEGGYPAIFSHPEHVWAAPIWWAQKMFAFGIGGHPIKIPEEWIKIADEYGDMPTIGRTCSYCRKGVPEGWEKHRKICPKTKNPPK